MKNIAFLVLTFAWIHISNSFRLQGTWALKEVKEIPVYQSVTMEIQDYIFRESQIMRKIMFSGCQTYKYMLEVSQNNIFLKYSTFQLDQVKQQANYTSECSQNSNMMHTSITSRLAQVFYFQIFGNLLVFLNPKKQILFRFQRQESAKIKILRGIWNINPLNGSQTSQAIQIADTEMSLCQGKLVVGYRLSDKYSIKTRLISNTGCSQKQLESIVLSSVFYRRIGKSVQIYNSGLQLIMGLSYLNDIDLQSAQKQRLAAIQQAKNIQQKKKQAQVQSQNQPKPQTTTSTKLSNTKNDLIGKWQPLSVFGMPLNSTLINLIFTKTQIFLNGGCSSFQFQYTSSEIINSLNVGQNRSNLNNNKCPVDDDVFYINAITKMNKYSLTVQGIDVIKMKVTDIKGNMVYELKRIALATTPSPTTNNSQQNTPNTQVVVGLSSLSLELGKYLFLVLARRDLPRKFCTVTPAKITYEGCNSIEHVYKTSGNNQIKISGGVTTGKTCAKDNDEIIFNTFNSVASFQKGTETGSYILKNANNVDIINLSLF